MKIKSIVAITIFLSILFIPTVYVHAESSYEIIYDKAPYTFYYPFEHSVSRTVTVKNTGNQPLVLEFRAFITGGSEQSTDVSSWPQLAILKLAVGEQQDIVMQDEQMNSNETWKKDQTYDYPFTIKVYANGNPSEENKSVDLVNKLVVLSARNEASNVTPNAKITGKVIDATTKKPVSGAEVWVNCDGPQVSFKATTDATGTYTLPIYAYKRTSLGTWLEYSIKIQASGYEEYYKAIAPKTGETINIDTSLIQATESADYQLKTKYDTGLPTYRVSFSANGKYFATVPFHSTLPLQEIQKKAYLHFFSTEGKLLWRYKLDNEAPTVSVSDDGKYIATIHRISETNWSGGDGVLVFNLDGSLYWKYDYPKTPDSWGTSEVVISHNNKYLGVGTVDGRFLLLDLTTKKLLWSTDLQGQIRYALFNENDSAVFFGGDPYLYSYSTNGNLNWKTNIGAWPYSLTESKNYIFAGVKAGVRLSLINKNTGDIVWSYPVDAHPDTLLISPDESMFVYQASIGGLALKNAFFDKNGKLLFNLPSARSGMFTPDGNYMVYYSGDNVTLVNKRGSTLWSAGLDKEIWPVPRGSVWISPDTKKIIVTSSVNGNVYFFEGGVHKENTPEANSAQSTQSGSHGNLVLALALFLVISVVLVAIVIVIVRAYKKKAVNKLK